MDSTNERLQDVCQRHSQCREIHAQITEIEQHYQSLSSEVDGRVLNLAAVDCLPARKAANTWVDVGSCRSSQQSASVTSPCADGPADSRCIYSVRGAWDWLQSAAKCLTTHLHNAAEYHKFYHEVSHYSKGLRVLSSQLLLRADVNTQTQHEALQQFSLKIKDTLQQLLDCQAKIEALFTRSYSIVPVHLRRLTVHSDIRANALVNYSHNPEISVEENDAFVLIDNSDISTWKVRTGSGVEVNLPSLILVIPPPDRDAVLHADRLRQQLMSTWQTLLHAAKTEARKLLGAYLSSNDSRDVAGLSTSQRGLVTSCLADMLRVLEPDSPSSVNTALNFQKLVTRWKQAVQNLSTTVLDRRTTQVFREWQCNEKLLRQIEEFEAFIGAYRESLLSRKQMKEQLINDNDPYSLKYISMAYIERWPHTASGGTTRNGTGDHLIISEMGPTQTDRYISRLEGEIEEFMTETITEYTEDDGEVTTQTIKETQTFVICGVVDPRTGEEISIYHAVADRIINQTQGLYRNPVTGESMSIAEAMSAGLIIVERTNRTVEMGELIRSGIIRTTTKRETVTYSVLSIRDPTSGEKIGVDEALRRGIIDQDAGRYVIDLRSGESISIPAAIDRGFLEVEVVDKRVSKPPPAPVSASQLDVLDSCESAQTTGTAALVNVQSAEDGLLVTGVFDPHTRKQLSLDEAIQQGIVDTNSGTFFNTVTGESCPLSEAIRRGYLCVELSGGKSDDPNVIGRKILALGDPDMTDLDELVATATRSDGRQLQVDVNHNVYGQLRDGLDFNRTGIIDPATGQEMSVEEAVHSGVLVLDPLGFATADGQRITLQDAAASGLININLLRDMIKTIEPLSIDSMTSSGIIDHDGNYYDPDTGEVMPINVAIAKGLLDPYRVFFTDSTGQNILSLGTAIENGMYDPSTGMFIDKDTGVKLSLADAIAEGFIGAAINADEMADGLAVLKSLGKHIDTDTSGIINPQTGEEVTVAEAVLSGLLDLSVGEYVNPSTGERMSIANAVSKNLISMETAKKLLSAMDQSSLAKSGIDLSTGKFVDPVTHQRMTIQQAIDQGLLEPASVFVADPSTGQVVSLATLIRDGTFNVETGRIRDPSSNREISLADAAKKGNIGASISVEDFVPPDKLSVKELLGNKKPGLSGITGVFVMPGGQTMSVEEAMSAGLLSSDAVLSVDKQTGNVMLADGVQGGLVEAMMNLKTSLDWVEGVEKQLADSIPHLSDAATLKQDILSLNDLKGSIDGYRDDITKQLALAQKLIGREKHSGDANVQHILRKLSGSASDLRARFDGVAADADKRLNKMTGMLSRLEAFEQHLNAFDHWIGSADHEIDEYKKCIATVEDLTAVRNSFRSFNDEILMKEAKLQEVVKAGQQLIDAKKVYDRTRHADDHRLDGENHENGESYSESMITGQVTEAKDKFQTLVSSAAALHAKLDMATVSSQQYDNLSKELNRTLPEVESLVEQCTSKNNRKGETEADIQQELEMINAAASRVAAVGKTVGEMQKTGDALINALQELGQGDVPRADQVRRNLESVQSRYDAAHEKISDKQKNVSTAFTKLQDPSHNLDMLLDWVSKAEEHLNQLDTISVDPDLLAKQIEEHQAFAAEVENRRPRIHAVTEMCQANDQHRADELLDRFDALQFKCDEHGQALESIVSRMSDLQGGMKQLDVWLGATLNSLKHDRSNDRDAGSLRTRIEGIHRQKVSREADVERVKSMAKELIDDPLTGDKHCLRETMATLREKWQDLTDRLVQMISYAALLEVDELLKYLDRAENEINSADAISADPETLAVQLAQHKTFHDDLLARRHAVGDAIDRCNRLLRETTNEEADDIRCKLATIRDQADFVFRLSSDRLQLLEDALPITTHFTSTHSDLRAWIDEIGAEIKSIEISSDGNTEQIRKQVDGAKTIQRIIEDHKPLVDDLVSTGQELINICSPEDGQAVRDDVAQVTSRYDEEKRSIRDKLHVLNAAIQPTAADAHESLDGLVDELHHLRSLVYNADPIAISPADIQEQISDNRNLTDDVARYTLMISKTQNAVQHALQQQQDDLENDDDRAELLSKMQDAELLHKEITEAVQDRASRLDEALFVAENFQQVFGDVKQLLRSVQENLLSQDSPGIDPATIQEQLRELQAIKDDMSTIRPSVVECQQTADQLETICGSPGNIAIQKHLEDMNTVIEDIEEGLHDREIELNRTLQKADVCTNILQEIMTWLPAKEERLQKMAPPAAEVRSVRIQLEELKVFKVQSYDRYADIQKLNHLANQLKNISPMSADSLMPEVDDVNQRWNQLISGIRERERLLKSRLIDLGDIDHALDDTIGFLQQTECDLQEMENAQGDPNVIETHIKKAQLLLQDLANQEPIIQELNEAVESLASRSTGAEQASLLNKRHEMNESFAVVRVLARDKLHMLNDRLLTVKDVMCSADELCRWLSGYNTHLKSLAFSALPDVAQQQMEQFMEGYHELEAKEEEAKRVLLNGEDLISLGTEPNTLELRDQFDRLSKQLYDVRLKANKHKVKIDDHLSNVENFQAMLVLHGDWLNGAEQVLADFKYPSKLVDRVIQQIAEHKQFCEDIETHRDVVNKLEIAGMFLRYFGRKQDSVYIRTYLIAMKLRWKKLMRRTDEKGRLLAQAYREDKRFYDSWKTLCDWLDSNDQLLRKSTGNAAKIKQDIDELQREMATRHGDYSAAMRLGRNLKDRCTKTDPEKEILSNMVDELKSKWNSLRAVAMQRQTKLDEALLTSGRISDAMQALMEWLNKAESYLIEDQPTLGDIDTVSILIEQHKSFQQELAARQTMMEAIRNSVGGDAEAGSQMEELNRAWENVNRLSDVRDSRLQEALILAEEFSDAVQVIREWLPQAEAELKFRAISEDEDGILLLIEKHDRFQEELRSQQPQIERIVQLAEEILSGCHPNAVRFVRYYLTITQTRWQQAVQRSEQRATRLQEALRAARGSAALVEELLTWLTEAHALLVAKERDPISDDLTVIEALLRQHMEFYEDLTAKNKEMEKLATLPASPAPGGRHHVSGDPAAFSARVGMLHDKWRTVWRLSVDRKKLLQDTLDHLLELESFKNFDFDEWRQRYMMWIRDKKFRITDFFRRQDKRGEGTLLREQFVEGMMTSKFPTNRTELNAVFDIFDRYRTGEINYSEFVDALRPERQHGAKRTGSVTDAELIHDEVEQQLSQCQCRRQFPAAKLGEGKYKFGEKGKLCLVRYLNSTVMVRVGGGWITLASFLESNDPCRAKSRLNTDFREQRRPSVPGTPALNGRLSGSTSSLSSAGNLSAKSMPGAAGGLAAKKNSQLAKSCSNIPSDVKTPPVSSAGRKNPSVRGHGSSAVTSTSTPKPRSSVSSAGSLGRPATRSASIPNLAPGSATRTNGSTPSARDPPAGGSATSARSTRTSSTLTSSSAGGRPTTPNGSRSSSPAAPRSGSGSASQDRGRLTSVRQSMKF